MSMSCVNMIQLAAVCSLFSLLHSLFRTRLASRLCRASCVVPILWNMEQRQKVKICTFDYHLQTEGWLFAIFIIYYNKINSTFRDPGWNSFYSTYRIMFFLESLNFGFRTTTTTTDQGSMDRPRPTIKDLANGSHTHAGHYVDRKCSDRLPNSSD